MLSPSDENGLVATHGRDGSFARHPSKVIDGESAGCHMRAKAIHYSGMVVENEDLTEVTSRAEVYRIKVLGPLGLSLVADRHQVGDYTNVSDRGHSDIQTISMNRASLRTPKRQK